jgi:hypothetical protein
MPFDHPDPRILERFMRNETSLEERRWIVRHLLAGCASCGAVTRRLWELGEPGPQVAAAAAAAPGPRPERRERGTAPPGAERHPAPAASLLDAYWRFLGEGMGAEAAATLLDLAVLYTREGRAAEILPLTRDMLPIFQAPGLRRGIAAALVCFREVVESGQATVGLLEEVARYVKPAAGTESEAPAVKLLW